MWKKILKTVNHWYAIALTAVTSPYWAYMMAKRFKESFGISIFSNYGLVKAKSMFDNDDPWMHETLKNIVNLR